MGHERLGDVFDRVEQTATSGRLPIVVFDLDSTLFSTRSRNLAILREFAHADHGIGGLQELVTQITEHDLGWDVAAPLIRAGVGAPRDHDALRKFWKDRFFTDEYVLHDEPHPGAVEYVQEVHDRGGFAYYLTGRHVGGMETGTIQSLTQHGFPMWGGRSTLHLKPNFHMPDKLYKDQALDALRSHHGEVVATFENEPGNANLFVNAFPDALHFLLLTEHSPEAEAPHPELIKSKDFLLP